MWLLHCYVTRHKKVNKTKKHKTTKKTVVYPAPRVLQFRSFCLKIPPKFFLFFLLLLFVFTWFHLLFSVSGKGWLVFSCGLLELEPFLSFSLFS